MPDDGHTRLNTGTELSRSRKKNSAVEPIWDDEHTKAFYESDLRVFVPGVPLGEAEPKFVDQEGELFENTCGISDVFGNREYPVGNGKAIHYSKSELIGLAEVVLFTIFAALYLHKKLLVGVALVLLACTHVQSTPAALPDIESLNFGDSYDTFFNLMHGSLEANTQPVRGHFILPPEMDMNDPNIPSRWIGVEVAGDDGVAIMYFRADTIYLVGFMNSAGTLYCTDDAVDIFPIAGCTQLGFKSNYHDLTERPSKSVDLGLFMQEALLGSQGANEATNVLAMYGVTSFEQSAVKNAMLAYSIMIAEAMRFKPIRDLVKENWEHSTVLPKELCNQVFVWQDLSILWCRGDRITEDEPEWDRAIERLDKANIRNEQDVDRALDLVKYEKPCKDLRRENP